LAYLPQRGEVDWRFPISGRKLVLTGRYVHLGWLRRPGQQDRAIAAEVLERLGLSILADRRIGQLSVGQQQRALLARALAQHADLLLLDEPLNAVDAKTRTVISDLWREFQRRGKTVVVATHDLGRLAAQRSSSPYDAPLLADRGGLRSGRALYLVLRQRAVRRSYRARLQCLLRAGMADPGTPRAMGR
jgi:ABC-type Mn2+/Zn2+ transport system ATPase subunit